MKKQSFHYFLSFFLIMSISFLFPSPMLLANPPEHAPAYGYRDQDKNNNKKAKNTKNSQAACDENANFLNQSLQETLEDASKGELKLGSLCADKG